MTKTGSNLPLCSYLGCHAVILHPSNKAQYLPNYETTFIEHYT